MLRKAEDIDFVSIINLNQKHLPAVSGIDMQWLQEATRDTKRQIWLWQVENEVLGLLILVFPKSSYKSVNYQFFDQNYSDFVYVDRIIVADALQGQGIGRKMYDFIIDLHGDVYDKITCEVNTKPRNESSLAFHHRLGFKEVGTLDSEGGLKQVSFLLKTI